MCRYILVVLLITVFVIVNGDRSKRKSLKPNEHGAHFPPGHRGRLSKHNLNSHKPVGESPPTIYKDEWLKMTKYTKTKSADCKKKCGKHQVCLIDQSSGETECFSRHNFREGRRLFRKFRNHDKKGLKKSIEEYSKKHQENALGPRQQQHDNKHKVEHPASPVKHHSKHPQQKQENLKDKHHQGHKKAHPEKEHLKQKHEHPGHKKEHPEHEKEHPEHKKEHPEHKKEHPEHKKEHKKEHSELKKEHKEHKKEHQSHKKEHHQEHQTEKKPGHTDNLKQNSHHQPHHKNNHHQAEITNNHSGPQKKEDKLEEYHVQLRPSAVNGHVMAVDEKEAERALNARVSAHKDHVNNLQRSVIKRLMGKKSHKGHHKLGHGKNHKKNHSKHQGKHHGNHKHGGHKHRNCNKKDLDIMSARLTGWFALIHARNEEKLHHKIPVLKHVHKCDCQETSIWAFHQFDHDKDQHLNHTELRQLETNQNEPCLTPLMESCDHNLDSRLSRKEWCCCFAETQPPCLKTKQSLRQHHLLGSFSPRCDENGYYEKEQCHSGTGYCWCVDLNGNEIANTRALKKAHCENLSVLGYKLKDLEKSQQK